MTEGTQVYWPTLQAPSDNGLVMTYYPQQQEVNNISLEVPSSLTKDY